MRVGRSQKKVSARSVMGGSVVLAMLALAACGSGSTSEGASGSSGGKGVIVEFGASQAEPYLYAQHKAAVAEAKRLGYKLKTIQNQFSASEQNQQIKQYLASGERPKAFLIWAVDPEAVVALAAQLSKIAPVFAENQSVAKGGFKYIKAYTGANNILVGKVAGENLTALKDKLVKEGHKFRTPGGGVLSINSPAGLSITNERIEGLKGPMDAAGMKLIEDYQGCASPDDCFKAASLLVPKYKDKLDFIYATSNSHAAGIIKAVQQSGLKPGKDIWIVTGNCGGPGSVMSNGVYATGGQYATVEGAGMIRMIAKYFGAGEKIATGKKEVLTAGDAAPEVDLTSPPAQYSFLPNPPLVGADSLDGQIWGAPVKQACPVE